MQFSVEDQKELESLVSQWMKSKKLVAEDTEVVVGFRTVVLVEFQNNTSRILDEPITKFGFSTRTLNVLRSRSNSPEIHSIGELVDLGYEGIIKRTNAGHKTFLEIRGILQELGVKLDFRWKAPKWENQGWEPDA